MQTHTVHRGGPTKTKALFFLTLCISRTWNYLILYTLYFEFTTSQYQKHLSVFNYAQKKTNIIINKTTYM